MLFRDSALMWTSSGAAFLESQRILVMTIINQALKKRGVNFSEMGERLKQAGNLHLYPPPHESQQEEFAKLCLRLLSNKKGVRGSVIGLASSASGEGSSFISFNLASILGYVYQQKVAWIDGNFRSPQMQLQGYRGPTFVDLLKNPKLADELPSDPSQMTLVSGGDNLRDVRAFFTESNYSDLLAVMASNFDFTIIDLPPVLENQDTALMAKGTDGILLVVAQRQLKFESIRSGVHSLQEVGVHLLGAVMNRREFDLPGFLHKLI